MSSFISTQGKGATATTSGQESDKPLVPWPAVMAMFKTTSIPKPAVPIIPGALLIAANTTLEEDKATLLAVYLAMGGEEDDLRTVEFYDESIDLANERLSDDVSEWRGVEVGGGRVTGFDWHAMRWGQYCLTGSIPSQIGTLSALTELSLCRNKLTGPLPSELGGERSQ